MAGRPNDTAFVDCHVIDAQLYHHLVTGNSQGFIAAVQRKLVDELRYPKDNSNVLHVAASFGHVDIVDVILEQWPTLLLTENSKGDLPLHSAIKAGQIYTAAHLSKWLHQQDNMGETMRQVFKWKNADGNTALHIALDNDQQEMAHLLVDLYPPALYVMNLNDICPLYLAIKLEMKDLVEFMLIKLQLFREDANRSLRKGKSVLQTVITAKKIEMLQHMLKYDPELINSKDNEGRTALSYAAYIGDLEKARLLIRSNPDIMFMYDQDGTYPIHKAVVGGHTNVIKLLANSKFLLNAKGQNIIHVAILTGNTHLVCSLLNTMPEVNSLINQKDDDGNTPLHLATLANHVEVIELLLQDVRVKIKILNNEGLTVNDLAKKLILDNQDISMVQKLNVIFERRAKTGHKCAIEGDLLWLLYQREISRLCQVLSERKIQFKELGCLEGGSNILHIAAGMDRTLLNQVIDLLEDQFDIFMEQANNLGDLPIHAATQAGNLGSLMALFERLNIPADDICLRPNMKGNTPLHIAVSINRREIANYLYKKCQIAAYSLNKDNICPLFLAILYWHESDIVIEMINALDGNTIQNHLKGAKPLIHVAIITRRIEILKRLVDKAPALLFVSYDSKWRTPLSYAAHIGYAEGVEFLLQRFPDLEFNRDKDEDGSFPIHQATKGGQLEILKLLHPENCLVNSKSQNILHVAAETGKVNVVKYLLERKEFKALLSIGDEDGNTPLHLAVKGQSYNVLSLLASEIYTYGNALNNELLTARDMFNQQLLYHRDNNILSSFQIDVVKLMLEQVKGTRSFLRKNKGTGRTTNEEEMEMDKADARDKASIASNMKRSFSYMDRANAFLVVAALVITATFAAAMAPPGGFDQKSGKPVLLTMPAFKMFLSCNSLAFMCAVGSALCLVLGTIVPKSTHITLMMGGLLILTGLLMMSASFEAGLLATNQMVTKKGEILNSSNKFRIISILGTSVGFLGLVNFIVIWRKTIYKEQLRKIRLWFCTSWPLPQRHTHLDFTI